MRKGSILVFVILSMFMFTAASCTLSGAADYTRVGVVVGDTADYAITASDPSDVFNASRAHLNVVNINGTIVTLNITWFKPDGSVANHALGPSDITTSNPLSGAFIIAAGLSKGDPLCPGSFFRINDTVSIIVANISRFASHLSYTVKAMTNPLVNYYWDNETGLALRVAVDWSGGYTHYEMTSTSTFSRNNPSDQGTTLLLLAAGIIGVAAVVIAAVVLRSGRGVRSGKT